MVGIDHHVTQVLPPACSAHELAVLTLLDVLSATEAGSRFWHILLVSKESG